MQVILPSQEYTSCWDSRTRNVRWVVERINKATLTGCGDRSRVRTAWTMTFKNIFYVYIYIAVVFSSHSSKYVFLQSATSAMSLSWVDLYIMRTSPNAVTFPNHFLLAIVVIHTGIVQGGLSSTTIIPNRAIRLQRERPGQRPPRPSGRPQNDGGVPERDLLADKYGAPG